MENIILLELLEKHLGKGVKRSKHNYAFMCPFCKERREAEGKSKKPKLEIQLVTNLQGENRYACWYCGIGGKTIKSLFKKLKLNYNEISGVIKPIDTNIDFKISDLTLPKEFIPLYPTPKSIYAKKVLNYLNKKKCV